MNIPEIQAIIARAVENGLPCCAAAVTDGDNTLLETYAGTVALGQGPEINPETLFWIASMTKPITSLAALQLVDAGKLTLDDPAEQWLPELARPQILQDGSLRPAARKITLKHLLTHTSGFAYAFSSPAYAAYLAAQEPAAPRGSRQALDMPLLFEPGTAWEYGLGTDWVGLAVEAASGQRLDAYFEQHIFSPLDMRDTTFLPGVENRAWLHQRKADGSLHAIAPRPAKIPEFYSGGGGLHATLPDYQKFCRAMLNGGAGLISPASYARLTTNQVGGLRAGVLHSADPAFASGREFAPGQVNRWSLGFEVFEQAGPFGRHAGSFGWAGAANTYFWIDPKINRAAIILMQLLPAGDLAALKTYFAFERAVYAAAR